MQEQSESTMQEQSESTMQEQPESTSQEQSESTTQEQSESATQEQPESTTQEQSESTTQEQPESTTQEQSESTTQEQPESTTQEQSESTTQERSESTTQEQSESTTQEQPESTTQEQSESTTQEQPESTTQEQPESTTQEQSESTTQEQSESTTQKQSQSTVWRTKGNAHYQQGNRKGLAPALRSERFLQAINCYEKALSTAADDDERSSACKNMAMANWKVAMAEIEMCRASIKIKFYFKTALRNFEEAKKIGRDRIVEWHAQLKKQHAALWHGIHSWLTGREFEDSMRTMEQLVPIAMNTRTKAKEFYFIAKAYFHESLNCLGYMAYKDCLRLLAECYFPLNEARRVGRTNSDFLKKCDLLDEDISIQRCMAESIQARHEGEELLRRVIRNEEDLNIDVIWEVVDWFTQAAMLTRDRDLEQEAVALSAVGEIYDRVLKLKDRAKKYMMKALELANTMVPRTFVGDGWYEVARSTLKRYQQETLAKEEEERKIQREGIMKLIKEELDVMKSKFRTMGRVQFLKFVYTTHPPKNPEHKLAEVSSEPEPSQLKKLYQKAVIHYHPDKVTVEEHGDKWKVLTEEITKLLTTQYEYYKGCM